MSSSAKTAPYGSWKSPITSDLIVAQSISLSDVRLDGGQILLAGRTPAGAGPLRRGARRRGWPPDRRHAGALKRPHPRARIRRRSVDDVGRDDLLLQFRRRPPLSPGAGWVRAAAVDAGAARARPAVAVRRRRDRPAPQPLDRRARGSLARRRAGQCHRRRRSRRRSRGRSRAGARARFLRLAATLARRKPARLAGLGSPQHAVERHAALPCRHRRPRRAG